MTLQRRGNLFGDRGVASADSAHGNVDQGPATSVDNVDLGTVNDQMLDSAAPAATDRGE